jgi:CheY-like chemotaxis protein
MHKPYVLVVEDNKDLRQLYTYALYNWFEVETAENGAEAMASIRQRKPDVVLADIMMPVMDGIELLEQLKKDAQLASLPVMIVSSGCAEYLHEAQVVGATKVIRQPVDIAALSGQIWELLSVQTFH